MQKILVLRGGALGDFLVTLPAIALLRQRWPAAHIVVVGNATAAMLALKRGLIDTLHSQHEARWSALYGDAALPVELASWLAEFDLIVNYWPDPDGVLRRKFPRRPDQVFLTAAAMPLRAPAAAHYCEPLRELGLIPTTFHYRLAPLVATSALASEGPPASPVADARGYIAIHPGSGSPRKNWPLAKWRKLIERLASPVKLIVGEAELEHSSGPALATWPAGLLVSRPLEELVEHLARCRLFLGHDSGISHLAAASGARCILLFGPTDPAMWAPPAPHVRVLRGPTDLASFSVDEVMREVTRNLQE